jgi:curved DNA-binding protein CbpA
MKWFTDVTCIEDLKAQYKKLIFKYHPDHGGDTAQTAEIIDEYKELYKRFKDIHKNAQGETYKKTSTETPEEFIVLVNSLLTMQGIKIDIVGSFVWVYGDTKQHKDALKALGFRWAPKKKMWYKAPADYHRRGRGEYTYDHIREKYGVAGHYETDSDKQRKYRFIA